MERADQLQMRLDNIQAVEPILAGLRTLSSGTRLRALSQSRRVDRYGLELMRVLGLIVPHLPSVGGQVSEAGGRGASVLLVVGSEHGLCGAFNDTIVTYAGELLQELAASGDKVDLWALGTRLQRGFRKVDLAPLWSAPLSLTALPPYELAARLALEWLHSYEKQELDTVVVAYNSYRGLARYEPQQVRLLPPQLPKLSTADLEWPPVIETEPVGLFVRTVELWLSATLYTILLESAAAEHAARYAILDGAVQNAGRLSDELRLLLQSARQDSITAELQDLASGAGLVGERTAQGG